MASRSSYMSIPEVTQIEGIRLLKDKLDILTTASQGAFDLSYDTSYLNATGGDYIDPVVFARPSGGVQHSDEADPTGTLTAAAISQAKGRRVIQANVGYYTWQRDEVMRGKMTKAQYKMAVAGFLADDKLVTLRNNGTAAACAAVTAMDTTDGSTAGANIHTHDVARGSASGAKVPFSFTYMNTLLGKMGDAQEDIVCFVIPSVVYQSLIADGLANYKVENVAGAMVISGAAMAMGRSLIVADIPALTTAVDSSYYTKYSVLGLAKGAITAKIVSEDPVTYDTTTTTNVMSYTARQDFDVEWGIQGMKWDPSNGAIINPTDTELATGSSWEENYGSHKEAGLILGIYNAS